MTLSKLLKLQTGDVVAIVGCNGKTSLLYTLAEENRAEKVLLSTTTHIHCPESARYDRMIGENDALQIGVNLLCGGIEGEKLYGVNEDLLYALCPSDGLTLLECDGSRGLPFKGWAEHEPVIPVYTTLTVGVCATWKVGSVFSEETVHRPQQFQELTGARPGAPVTVEHLAAMVSHQRGMFQRARGRRALLINGCGCDTHAALVLARHLPSDFCRDLSAIVAADLHRGCYERIGETI